MAKSTEALKTAMGKINILVYGDHGISNLSLSQTVDMFKQKYRNRYALLVVDSIQLANEPWEDSTALLAIPGGQDLEYLKHLGGLANSKIKQYVEQGGKVLGICAGAYYFSSTCVFEPNSELEVIGDRPLKFFPGECRGAAYPGFRYNSEVGARAVKMRLNTEVLTPNLASKEYIESLKSPFLYYNGGGYFVGAGDTKYDVTGGTRNEVQVLAWYPNDVFDPYNRDKVVENAPSMILCRVGKGLALLSGVHFEVSYSAFSIHRHSLPEHVLHDLKESQQDRLKLLDLIFYHLGLQESWLPDGTKPVKIENDLAITPSYIVPIKNVSVTEVANFTYKMRSLSSNGLIRDSFDNIKFDILEQLEAKEQQARPENQDQNLDSQDARGDKRPIELYFCNYGTSSLDHKKLKFDLSLFKNHMNMNKTTHFGSWVIYTDITTSTQTFLEKNIKIQAALPNPTVNIAFTQTSGRGRGKNMWVSPPGCLQFSILFKHPQSSTAPAVMLQYLMTLAVVEAVRSKPGYQDLPLHIKWPNDLYICTHALDHTNSKRPEKFGGSLVNSSFENGTFSIVIGTGVNINNSQPLTSINNLITRYNELHNRKLKYLSLEQALADILSKFEKMYYTFLVSGFSSFEKLYYSRWLHTDQIVKLKSYDYVDAKIIGIDTNQGFLKAQSVSYPYTMYSLQPDGNSFDMLSGLIAKKE